jgi:hypothetical protein
MSNLLSFVDSERERLPVLRRCITRSIQAVGAERLEQDAADVDIASELAMALTRIAELEWLIDSGSQLREDLKTADNVTPAEIQRALEAAGPMPRRRRGEEFGSFWDRLSEWAFAGGGIPETLAAVRIRQGTSAQLLPESHGPDEGLPALAYRPAHQGGSVPDGLFFMGAPS